MRSFLNITLALLFISGCGPTEDQELAELQRELLTDSVPTDLISIAYATQIAAGAEGQRVSLVGRIYGGEFEAFDKKQASFSMVDLPEEGHSHDDPGDCPFCKRKMDAAAMAVIQFTDEQGKLIEHPADKLLGLTDNQDVVVTGTARLLDNTLVVSADSVHLPQDAYALEIMGIMVGPSFDSSVGEGGQEASPDDDKTGTEQPQPPEDLPASTDD